MVMKRKIPSPCQAFNLLIIQPTAQHYNLFPTIKK
jgi:hypothetical protein